MKFKKTFSVLLSSAMAIGSSGLVFAQDLTYEEKILAATTAQSLNELLLSPEEGFAVDLADYSMLSYPIYAAEDILEAGYSDIETFQTVYTAVMAEMLTVSEVANYDLGANLVTSASGYADVGAYPGLEIRTAQVFNGKGEGFEGYIIYNSIAKPSEIVSIKAVITGHNAGKETNDRSTYINGYSTILPQYRDNKTASNSYNGGNYVDYEQGSTEYNAWVDYSSQEVTSYVPDVFKFADGSLISNEVDISGITDTLKTISDDSTPLVIRFSEPTPNSASNQRINGMKLTVTHDATIAMHKADVLADEAFAKIYAAKDDAQQLVTAINALEADEIEVMSLDLTAYNSLSYPVYAAEKIVEAGFDSVQSFQTALDAAVASMIETVEISNYDWGAHLVTSTTGYSDFGAYPGLEIRTSSIYNGANCADFSGYAVYSSIANPSSIISMTADAEGSNAGSSSQRETYITGYSTVLPEYRDNLTATNSSNGNNYVDYAQDSKEYNSWVAYSETISEYEAPPFTFANNVKTSNNVDLSGLAERLKEVKTTSTPLVLRFSRPEGKSTSNQRINILKLAIAYDKTIELYNEEHLAEEVTMKLLSAKNDAAQLENVLSAMTSDEAEAIGVDMAIYKKLANPSYAAEAIAAEKWGTAAEFKTAFESAVASLIETKSYHFDMGAVVSTNETNTSDKYGLQFKSGLIRNGKTSGVTGYAMYYTIADPYAVMDIAANVTGQNAATATNDRNIHITGYCTSALTDFVDESDIIPDNGNYIYAVGTDIYNSFAEYAGSFAELSGDEEIIISFKTDDVDSGNRSYMEGVDLSVIADGIKVINKPDVPLALRFSNGTQNNSINKVELVVTYDRTAVMKYDEGVVADVNSIVDSMADSEVLSIADKYAQKLLGELYTHYCELANSVRVEAFRALAAEQCSTKETMSEKAVEIISVCKDITNKYTITAIDIANKYVTVKKNTNFTGNFTIVIAGYKSYALSNVTFIHNTNWKDDPNGVYGNYRDLRYASEGETMNIYIGDVDASESDTIKVMVLENTDTIKPMAKVFEK